MNIYLNHFTICLKVIELIANQLYFNKKLKKFLVEIQCSYNAIVSSNAQSGSIMCAHTHTHTHI